MIKLLSNLAIGLITLFCSCSVIKYDTKSIKVEGIIIYQIIDHCEIKVFLFLHNKFYLVDQNMFYRFKDFSGSYDTRKDLDIISEINYKVTSIFGREIGNDNLYRSNKEHVYYIPVKFKGHISIRYQEKNYEKEMIFENKLNGMVFIDNIISTKKITNQKYFDIYKVNKKTIHILCNDLIMD